MVNLQLLWSLFSLPQPAMRLTRFIVFVFSVFCPFVFLSFYLFFSFLLFLFPPPNFFLLLSFYYWHLKSNPTFCQDEAPLIYTQHPERHDILTHDVQSRTKPSARVLLSMARPC